MTSEQNLDQFVERDDAGVVQVIHLRAIDSQRVQPSDTEIVNWLRAHWPQYIEVAEKALIRR